MRKYFYIRLCQQGYVIYANENVANFIRPQIEKFGKNLRYSNLVEFVSLLLNISGIGIISIQDDFKNDYLMVHGYYDDSVQEIETVEF